MAGGRSIEGVRRGFAWAASIAAGVALNFIVILPVAIATLLAAHLILTNRRRFGPGRTMVLASLLAGAMILPEAAVRSGLIASPANVRLALAAPLLMWRMPWAPEWPDPTQP